MRDRIHKAIGEYASTDEIKVKAIALERINDMFEADHFLEKALEYFPDDPDLLRSMAVNRFQLGRLSSARAYAARALAADPMNRHPVFLSRVTWLFYYPGFYILLMSISIMLFMNARFHKWLAAIFGFAVIWLILPALRFSVHVLHATLGVDELRFGTVLLIAMACVFYLAVHPQLYAKIFMRKKDVRLKRY